jgi:flagellar motor switch protein FliM
MWFTEVDLEAVLDTQIMPLNRALNMKVGSKLLLNATPESPIILRCGDQPMFVGKMGRKGNNIAIRVDHRRRPDPSASS